MRIHATHAAALALAGTLAIASATPSFADDRWGSPAGGFAAGAYVYHPGFQGYAFAPAPTVVAPAPTVIAPVAPAPTVLAPAPGLTAYGFVPGFSTFSYGPSYDPENGSDPDLRLGGSFRMNSSRDD